MLSEGVSNDLDPDVQTVCKGYQESKERVMDLCFCLQATKLLEGLDIRKPVVLVVKYTNAVGVLIAVPEVCTSCKLYVNHLM